MFYAVRSCPTLLLQTSQITARPWGKQAGFTDCFLGFHGDTWNGELKPCLRIIFSSQSLPGYRVSEDEERSINDHVLLVNDISENDSRMAWAHPRNRHHHTLFFYTRCFLSGADLRFSRKFPSCLSAPDIFSCKETKPVHLLKTRLLMGSHEPAFDNNVCWQTCNLIDSCVTPAYSILIAENKYLIARCGKGDDSFINCSLQRVTGKLQLLSQ